MGRAVASRSSSRRAQRGVALIFGAVTTLLGLVAVGLAVDLSRLYSAQRELQSAANMAAMDAVRVAGGCFGRDAVGADPVGSARAEAIASITRNGGSADWLPGDGLRIGYQRSGEDRLRRFVPFNVQVSDGPFDAVEVRLERPTPPRLIPVLGPAEGRMVAFAAAAGRPRARIGVGSGLAELQLADSELNELLGGMLGGLSPGLRVADYRGLFGVSVTLGSLVTEINPGTPAAVLDQLISSQGLLVALADALGEAGETAAAQTAAALAAVAGNAPPVLPREVLGIPTDLETIGNEVLVNAGVLVNQLLRESARGLVNGVPLGIPCPLGPCTGRIRIFDPGQEAITTPVLMESTEEDSAARTAQVQVEVLGLQIPIQGLGNVSVDLTVDAAPARARVHDVRCPRKGFEQGQVTVMGETGLAEIRLRVQADLPLLRLNAQPAPLKLGSPLANPVPLVFSGPFDAIAGDPPQRVDTGAITSLAGLVVSLSQSPDINVELGGIPLPINPLLGVAGTLLGPAGGVLDPITGPVLGPLLAPALVAVAQRIEAALPLLGVQLGYADFRVYELLDSRPELFLR